MSVNENKKALRTCLKAKRAELGSDFRQKADKEILENLLSLSEIQNAKKVLCFVSTESEIDTKKLINLLIEMQKTIAVPKCIDKNGIMKFYEIASLDSLERNSFGILEPSEINCKELSDFSQSVCIVPALAFDKNGQRIGYGKGYYDRFLAHYNQTKIGICYDEFLLDSIICDKNDIAVDKVVTQSKK